MYNQDELVYEPNVTAQRLKVYKQYSWVIYQTRGLNIVLEGTRNFFYSKKLFLVKHGQGELVYEPTSQLKTRDI